MITLEQRNQQLQIIADQQSELYKQGDEHGSVRMVTVTCTCGRTRGITHAVRCLYCDIWYCELCAEEHFGQTRKEYRKKNPIEAALGGDE